MLKFLRKFTNLICRAKYTSEEIDGVKGAGTGTYGSLTKEQLQSIFRTLPFDLTFVDEKDRNRFYLLGHKPVFGRDEGSIGIPVVECHSGKSGEMVNRIINDFKNGRQNSCDFWFDHNGRFIHIKYLAVRNEAGKYIGTLEFIMDVSQSRELSGERREIIYN